MSATSGARGHGCLLPFDTDDPEFIRGFEAGRIWALLAEHPYTHVTETVHAWNAEMFLRMGEVLGRPVRSREVDETWIAIRFSPADPPSEAT